MSGRFLAEAALRLIALGVFVWAVSSLVVPFAQRHELTVSLRVVPLVAPPVVREFGI